MEDMECTKSGFRVRRRAAIATWSKVLVPTLLAATAACGAPPDAASHSLYAKAQKPNAPESTATVSQADKAATPQPPPNPTFNEVLGAISNAYGTFQAGQFVYETVLKFFGIGASSEWQTAVDELEKFMANYRTTELKNDVLADLRLFAYIAGNWQSPLRDDLEARFIGDANLHLTQLQGDIENGTMADAYTLAPAFNLLTAAFVGSSKAFTVINPANAEPQSVYDSYLDAAMNVDYSLVGAFFVSYDVFGGIPSMLLTQGGKKMWPKYAPYFYYYGPLVWDPNRHQNVYTNYYCDMTNEWNIDNLGFQSCWYGTYGQYSGFNALTSGWAALSGDALASAKTQAVQGEQRFDQDAGVAAVVSAMNGLAAGHNSVCDFSPVFPYVACGHVILTQRL